jgi:hypothetical protein
MTTEFFLLLRSGFSRNWSMACWAFYGGSPTRRLSIGCAGAGECARSHREIFTTGASAASHIYHRNVDWRASCRGLAAGVLAPFSAPDSSSSMSQRRADTSTFIFCDGRLPCGAGVDSADPRAPGRLDATGWLRSRFLDASGGGG